MTVSLDDISRHIIESVSNTTSTMLKKVSADDISSYQSYTIYVQYLDALCLPTPFPSGIFGESHPRKVPILASQFQISPAE